jgi:hypothetical protein
LKKRIKGERLMEIEFRTMFFAGVGFVAGFVLMFALLFFIANLYWYVAEKVGDWRQRKAHPEWYAR